MTADDLRPYLKSIHDGRLLSTDEAADAFGVIMSGRATPSQIGAFLMGLAVRGETVDEVTGAAQAMRGYMNPMSAPAGAMDVVGTGGDGKKTLNVSTATAIVVAGCGVTIAKHGNRAASSQSGAADVLSMSGVNLDADPTVVQRAINEIGLGFMLAPLYHSAMRHVMPTRVELGTRTIFNLLGPLANPAQVTRYLLGVFSADWVEPIARALAKIGCEKAWIVHSGDGCDELTLSTENMVAVVDGTSVAMQTVSAADAGLDSRELQEIAGGEPAQNAMALKSLLDGAHGAYRDTVLLNSAAALVVADRVRDLKGGVELAHRSIDSGAARNKLEKLAALTSGRN